MNRPGWFKSWWGKRGRVSGGSVGRPAIAQGSENQNILPLAGAAGEGCGSSPSPGLRARPSRRESDARVGRFWRQPWASALRLISSPTPHATRRSAYRPLAAEPLEDRRLPPGPQLPSRQPSNRHYKTSTHRSSICPARDWARPWGRRLRSTSTPRAKGGLWTPPQGTTQNSTFRIPTSAFQLPMTC